MSSFVFVFKNCLISLISLKYLFFDFINEFSSLNDSALMKQLSEWAFKNCDKTLFKHILHVIIISGCFVYYNWVRAALAELYDQEDAEQPRRNLHTHTAGLITCTSSAFSIVGFLSEKEGPFLYF